MRRNADDKAPLRAVALCLRWLLLATAIVAAPALAALPIQHWTSGSGVRVYFIQSRGLPMLDINIDFDAGGRRAPAGKAGLAGLTHTLVKTGSAQLTEEELSRRIADVGAELGGRADRDRAGFSLRTLVSGREREQALATFAAMLQAPAFPEAAFLREKARLIAALEEDATKPDAIAERSFYQTLYGTHPYARIPAPETVRDIARADVLNYFRTHYVAERAVLTLVGDADRALAERIAEKLTAGLAHEHSRAEPLPPVVRAPGRQLRIAHPATQAHILLGLPAIARGDADYFALLVGNYALGGGGFVSRLYLEVREKRGYAYSVYSAFLPYAQEGPFQIGLQTKKERAGEALAQVRAVLDGFLAHGPSPAEIRAAKQNLTGGYALRIDSNRKLLEQTAVIGYYRLPLTWMDDFAARIEKVTLAEVRAAFTRRISKDDLVTVIVGGGQD